MINSSMKASLFKVTVKILLNSIQLDQYYLFLHVTCYTVLISFCLSPK